MRNDKDMYNKWSILTFSPLGICMLRNEVWLELAYGTRSCVNLNRRGSWCLVTKEPRCYNVLMVCQLIGEARMAKSTFRRIPNEKEPYSSPMSFSTIAIIG